MKNYLVCFLDEFDYPAEAKEVLISAYDTVCENPTTLDKFNENIALFNDKKFNNGDDVLVLLTDLADIINVNKFTIHLLFYICLSKYTKELYKAQNISDQIFFDSMSDLKWKLLECHKMYGVWGSFVAGWFKGFFDMERFALGRLQFEKSEFNYDSYAKNGYMINKGDLVINMHIPSCGALTQASCLDSYKQAYEFYKNRFTDNDDIVPFVCDSWLLYPAHEEFLPNTSNIVAFLRNFEVVNTSIHENFGDLWRIFYKPYNNNINAMPRDTSLQKAYADWVSKGNPVGGGYGIFLFNGENIL